MTETVRSAGKAIETRRYRRQQIGRHMKGRLVTTSAPFAVANIGKGGFAMFTQAPVPVGTTSAFRFTAKDGTAFLVRGCVAHSRQVRNTDTNTDGYVSGVKFAVAETPIAQRALDMLFAEVQRILTAPPVPERAAPPKPVPALPKEAQRATPPSANVPQRPRLNRW